MKHAPLLSVAPFSGSRVQSFSGTKRYLSTGNLQDESISFSDITYKDRPSRADITVRPGDVLFARMKGTRKVLEIDKELSGIVVSTGFAVLRPTEECNAAYLATYLNTNDFERQKEKYCSGAIQPAITNAGIEKIKIPLPPPDEQIRIAHLLGKVEGLIALRKQHLQQLGYLLKGVFQEMFGDPVRNEKGWDTAEIEKLCEAVIDCPHSTPIYSDEKTGYYCVRSGDIVDGYLDLSKTLHVGRDVYEDRIKRYTPQIGDIVYSREGGRLGNAARILGDESICLGQRIMLFKASEENSADFLWALLESRSFKTKLQSLVGGGAAPRVNIKDLKKITVIQPPNDTQTQFSRITKRIDQIKSRYQQSLTDLENLYDALSQKAFKGELDLSRVPLQPITANLDVQEDADTVVATATVNDQQQAIELPDVEDMLEALTTIEGRHRLLQHWLKAYAAQLKGSAFSVNDFLGAAQVRMAELHPENDFELGITEYEQLKDWVFAALGSGRLSQVYDDSGNRVQVVAATS